MPVQVDNLKGLSVITLRLYPWCHVPKNLGFAFIAQMMTYFRINLFLPTRPAFLNCTKFIKNHELSYAIVS